MAENERFSFKEQMVYSEIDVECLRAERRVNTTFSASVARLKSHDVIQIDTELFASKNIELSRKSIRCLLFRQERHWMNDARKSLPYR